MLRFGLVWLLNIRQPNVFSSAISLTVMGLFVMRRISSSATFYLNLAAANIIGPLEADEDHFSNEKAFPPLARIKPKRFI